MSNEIIDPLEEFYPEYDQQQKKEELEFKQDAIKRLRMFEPDYGFITHEAGIAFRKTLNLLADSNVIIIGGALSEHDNWRDKLKDLPYDSIFIHLNDHWHTLYHSAVACDIIFLRDHEGMLRLKDFLALKKRTLRAPKVIGLEVNKIGFRDYLQDLNGAPFNFDTYDLRTPRAVYRSSDGFDYKYQPEIIPFLSSTYFAKSANKYSPYLECFNVMQKKYFTDSNPVMLSNALCYVMQFPFKTLKIIGCDFYDKLLKEQPDFDMSGHRMKDDKRYLKDLLSHDSRIEFVPM